MPYVYEELSKYDIADRLMQDDNAGWTHEQAIALAEHLIDFAQVRDTHIKLDLPKISADFTRYDTLQDAIDALLDGWQIDTLKDTDPERDLLALDYLSQDGITLLCSDNTVLFSEGE